MPRIGSLSAIALRFSISAIFLGPVLAPPERDFGGSFPESAPPIALETRAKLATNQNEFTRLRQFFFVLLLSSDWVLCHSPLFWSVVLLPLGLELQHLKRTSPKVQFVVITSCKNALNFRVLVLYRQNECNVCRERIAYFIEIVQLQIMYHTKT